MDLFYCVEIYMFWQFSADPYINPDLVEEMVEFTLYTDLHTHFLKLLQTFTWLQDELIKVQGHIFPATWLIDGCLLRQENAWKII